jgi:hypothetical protein
VSRTDHPTIALALPYAINVRDLLRTAVLPTLKAGGANLVLISPAHDDPAFQAEFAGPGVSIEPMHPYKQSPTEERLRVLRFTLFNEMTETVSFLSRSPNGRGLAKRSALWAGRRAARLLGRDRTQEILAGVETTLFPERRYDEMLARHRPDLLCVVRVIGSSPDYAVLKAAKRHRIPSVLIVSSWDNLTGKGVYPTKVDRMVVWNAVMVEEAVQLQGMRPEQVYAAGAPQFDHYADRSNLPDRATFCQALGGDAGKALVTYCLSNARMCPDEFDNLEQLWKAVRAGSLHRPAQVLARVHPMAGALGEAFPQRLEGLPDLLVDRPGRATDYADRDVSRADMRHLAATMLHSDVIINSASTVTIDAAAFDTSVVCALWDGYRTLPDDRSVRRLHIYTHYRKLMAMGGARVAYSLDELVAHINAYLEDPALDRQGRARIVERMCGPLDGKSGERVARYVLRAVEELRRP